VAKICNFKGCSNPVFSKGRCVWHQERKPIENKSRKPIKVVSEKMASNLAKYRKRRDAYFKDHPVCEFPGCNSRKITLHHKRGRTGAFLTDKRWFCSLCQFHHTYVNEHSEEARKMGLIYSRLEK
jgi:hypothetical protein